MLDEMLAPMSAESRAKAEDGARRWFGVKSADQNPMQAPAARP
jgi:hypothetical protein